MSGRVRAADEGRVVGGLRVNERRMAFEHQVLGTALHILVPAGKRDALR